MKNLRWKRTVARSKNPGGGAFNTVVGIICPPGWDRVRLVCQKLKGLKRPAWDSPVIWAISVHNPITLIKLDWKIPPIVTRVWTILYDTVSGVLDFFYTSKFQSNISWVFGLTFQHGKVINRAVKFSTLPLLFLKWNNNKNFCWHLVFSILSF